MTVQDGKIFHRGLVRMRRERRAAGWGDHDFLKREAARRLAECVGDLGRDFPLALDLGAHKGEASEALLKAGQVKQTVQSDLSFAMRPQVVCDEEFLPFADDTFDLAVSALSLHHVNDLPGALIQLRRCLKPGGLLVAILYGARTLFELRESVSGAGGIVSPRVSPFVEVRDAGALLQRAKFAEPVTDGDLLTVEYDDAFKLMDDLRGMGESNVLIEQRKMFSSRAQLAAIADYYSEQFGSDDSVPATFEFVTMTGWKE